MAMTTVSPAADGTSAARHSSYVEWGPIFAGAVAASAISFLLLTFGSAIGLSMTSAWPDSGARLWVVALAIGWFAVAVQIAAFAAGGYLAGRMRSRWAESADESRFRDNAHGFMVWALGVLMGGVMLALTTGGILNTAAQSASTIAGGAAAGAATSISPSDYATDLLLRSETAKPGAATAAGSDAALRSEVGRIFGSTIRNREFTARDRDYLVRVVQQRTGLPEAEARQRVDAAVNEARNLEIKVRDAADKARRGAVIAGFVAAVSLLISCAIACFTAGIGGRHRDEDKTPLFYGHSFW